ncbi:hypothetical protein K523DRAFT_380923, partial [Schizophyllum commune Tattone D]
PVLNRRKPAQAGFRPQIWDRIDLLTTGDARVLLRNGLHTRLCYRQGSAPIISSEHAKGVTTRSCSKIVWEKRKVNVWRQRYAAPNEARIGRALRVRDHRSSFEVLVALRRLPAFLTVTYGALWSKGTEKDFRAKWSEDGGEVRAKRYLFAFTGETEAKTKAK